MKTHHIILAGCVICVLALATGCKSSKKVSTYDEIYNEKPVTVYIAPIEDKTSRKIEKYPMDKEANEELNAAARYMYHTLSVPLRRQGYYTIGTLATEQIAKQQGHSAKQLRNEDIRTYAQLYGVDAILIVTIHRWKSTYSNWDLFAEYTLRSTKSNNDLMHTWVKASKQLNTDYSGNPVAMPEDAEFAAEMEMNVSTAQRCQLVQKVNDYVLRNLPVSSNKPQFEKDRYLKANPSYFFYSFTPDGEIEIENMSMESFEEECFVN